MPLCKTEGRMTKVDEKVTPGVGNAFNVTTKTRTQGGAGGVRRRIMYRSATKGRRNYNSLEPLVSLDSMPEISA